VVARSALKAAALEARCCLASISERPAASGRGRAQLALAPDIDLLLAVALESGIR
jgi:hypothetical protein